MKLFDSAIKHFISTLAIIVLLTVKSFACYGTNSHATNHIFNVSLDDIVIQRDAPTGATLLTKTISTGLSSGDYFATCYSGDQSHYLIEGGVPVSGYNQVYETNVPGIGIKVQAGTSVAYYTNPPMEQTSGNNGWAWSNWGTSFTISIIKTGAAGDGDISGITAVMSLDGVGDLLTLNVNSGKVTALACAINASKINAPLGDVYLPSFTGGGSTPKSYDFDVGLECDAGANINISLTGTQSAETSDTSILALTDDGEKNVATGVGVQVLYNNAPLKLNNNIVLKKSEGGQELFPFTVRYYQTKPKVTSGSANATATLNITYQ